MGLRQVGIVFCTMEISNLMFGGSTSSRTAPFSVHIEERNCSQDA
jgi:hypothetical protein